MKKKDLRDGDIVKLRCGGEYEVHTNGCVYFISGFDKKNYFELPLCFYDDDLTFRLFTLALTSRYDIIKVSQMWKKDWAHSKFRRKLFGTYWDWDKDKEYQKDNDWNKNLFKIFKEIKNLNDFAENEWCFCSDIIKNEKNKDVNNTMYYNGVVKNRAKSLFRVGNYYEFNNVTKDFEIKEKENDMKNNKCIPCRIGDRVTSSDRKLQIIGGYSGEDVRVKARDKTEIIKIERPIQYETIYEATKEPELKIGDIVEVVDCGECYVYDDNLFARTNRTIKYFKNGEEVKNGFIGKIVGMAKDMCDRDAYAILNHDEVYWIGEQGIKKTDKQLDILDKQEKEYLSVVIKPFRDKVKFIRKETGYLDAKKMCIEISTNDDTIYFPYFDAKSMYTGMKMYTKYTLKELGI